MAKILLADDSGTAQRMGAQILTAEGHEVTTVSNGQAAIKMLDKFSPDLIVADVFMPGKTGYELCELVKSDPNSAWIPVLLIVAPMEPYDATEGQRVKADGLVTKPLDKSNLVETVQALLASSKRPAAPSKKRGAKAAAVPEPEPLPEPAEMHDLPAEEDPTIPAISTTAALEIEIPEEMRNQPVSLVGELLEPEPPPPEPSAPEEFIIERSGGESSPMEVEPDSQIEIERDNQMEVELSGPAEAMLEPASPFVEPEPPEDEPREEDEPTGMDRLFAAAAEASSEETPFPDEPEMLTPTVSNEEFAASAAPSEPPAPPVPTWTAESVDLMEDDKRLFGQEPPDWQGLVNLVEKEDQQGHFPAVSSAAASPPPAEQSAPETSELSSRNAPEETAPEEPEPEQPAAPSSSAAKDPPQEAPAEAEPPLPSDTIAMMVPKVAPLDYATVEQIVRETLEEVMPQIVDRISQATGMRFPKKSSPKSEEEK